MDIRKVNSNKPSEVDTFCQEIMALIASGQVLSIEVMGQSANEVALKAMTEAKELLSLLGYDVEIFDCQQIQAISDSQGTDNDTQIKWRIEGNKGNITN